MALSKSLEHKPTKIVSYLEPSQSRLTTRRNVPISLCSYSIPNHWLSQSQPASTPICVSSSQQLNIYSNEYALTVSYSAAKTSKIRKLCIRNSPMFSQKQDNTCLNWPLGVSSEIMLQATACTVAFNIVAWNKVFVGFWNVTDVAVNVDINVHSYTHNGPYF